MSPGNCSPRPTPAGVGTRVPRTENSAGVGSGRLSGATSRAVPYNAGSGRDVSMSGIDPRCRSVREVHRDADRSADRSERRPWSGPRACCPARSASFGSRRRCSRRARRDGRADTGSGAGSHVIRSRGDRRFVRNILCVVISTGRSELKFGASRGRRISPRSTTAHGSITRCECCSRPRPGPAISVP